ncbi:MAG: tetratricopeptide repeat protein [Spirochaetes bacterium]|nr:MAG: tetratricopeptide repeat protein [Spirochaetota bacterium]
MRPFISIIAVFIYLACALADARAASLMKLPGEGRRLRALYHEADAIGWECVEVGKIVSISTSEMTDIESVSSGARGKTKLSARLYSDEGIKAGDELYVVNENNLIIAKMEVKTVFNSMSLGPMILAFGNFRFANEGDRVVQRSEGAQAKDAYIHNAKGDFHRETGQDAESIASYKRALELDTGNPEAHLRLGQRYLKDDMLPFAYKELSEAYKSISRLYDKEDRFALLKSLSETRYREAYFSYIKADLREKYIKEGIKYSKEALALYPNAPDVHFFLGTFYSRSEEPDDRKARDHLVTVTELEPGNVDALVMLSELYYKHRNMKKAAHYSTKALELEPGHERARYILKNSENE